MSAVRKSAWCERCGKLAESWDDMLVKDGWRRTVRCHGEQYRRLMTHGMMKHRAPTWVMEGLFVDTPIRWRERRAPGESGGGRE